MDTMMELPPPHKDTPQQRRALRQNKSAAKVRRMFPRGTRVESTSISSEPGNGWLGTVVSHIPGSTALGGHLNVLWDSNPMCAACRNGHAHQGKAPASHLGKALASSLLVVDPATGRGKPRKGAGE